MVGKKINLLVFLIAILLVALSFFYFFRIDLTSDNRYSISPQTKELMQNTNEPLSITLYLDGELNPGFQRLKKSTVPNLSTNSMYLHEKVSTFKS